MYQVALLRAVGQLALLVVIANGLWTLTQLATLCLDSAFPICSELTLEWIAIRTLRFAVPAAAVFTFRASLRADRGRRAVWGAVVIAVLELQTPIPWIVLVGAPVKFTYLLDWVGSELWLLAAMTLLAASYRRPTTLADAAQAPHTTASGRWWAGFVLVPLIAALWLTPAVLPFMPITFCLLVAGALYGVVQRVHPIPGAAPWPAVALTLVLLALPRQAYLVLADQPTTSGRILLAITLAAAALLAGWQLHQTHRQHHLAARRAPAASAEPG